MTEEPKKKGKKKWIIIIGGILAAFVCVIVIVAIGGGGGERTASGPQATATPKPIEDIDFFAIRDSYAEMTDAQWKPYVEGLEGRRVRWTGWVEDVDDNGRVSIDMDSPEETFSLSDCYFSVPKEEATDYNKDQKLTFDADLADIETFLGSMSIRLDEVVIISR